MGVKVLHLIIERTKLLQNPELLGKIEASILGFFSIDKFSQKRKVFKKTKDPLKK